MRWQLIAAAMIVMLGWAVLPARGAIVLAPPPPMVLVIDDFNDPDPASFAILRGPTSNPNPFFYQNMASAGLILGGQRDVEVEVYKNLTFNSAVVATGSLLGKGTLGLGVNAFSKAQLVLQYDGIDGSIANAQGLPNVDLTAGGALNAFRLGIEEWQSTTAPAINVVIDVTSPNGSATVTKAIATTAGTTPLDVDVPFADFTTTAGFLFSQATSVQFTINPSALAPTVAATDIRLDDLSVVHVGPIPPPVPEPAALAIWSVLGALGAVWAWRRGR